MGGNVNRGSFQFSALEEEAKRAKNNKEDKKISPPFCLFFCFFLPFLLPLPKELTGAEPRKACAYGSLD
jgi:hypothetical protein